MDARLTLIVAIILPNLLGFAFMALDKKWAKEGGFHLPESTFFCMALIGGSIGCLIGMLTCHHKTRKPAFFIGMPLILILQLAAVYLIWRSGLQFSFL